MCDDERGYGVSMGFDGKNSAKTEDNEEQSCEKFGVKYHAYFVGAQNFEPVYIEGSKF